MVVSLVAYFFGSPCNCNCVLQVRYTGYMDKTLHERQLYVRNDCREGHANVVSIIVLLSIVVDETRTAACTTSHKAVLQNVARFHVCMKMFVL